MTNVILSYINYLEMLVCILLCDVMIKYGWKACNKDMHKHKFPNVALVYRPCLFFLPVLCYTLCAYGVAEVVGASVHMGGGAWCWEVIFALCSWNTVVTCFWGAHSLGRVNWSNLERSSKISRARKVLSRLRDNSHTKFVKVDIKFCFTCGE